MCSKLYIYLSIYSTINMIPTTLRYSPLLQVSGNGAVEMRHESGDLQSSLYPVWNEWAF